MTRGGVTYLGSLNITHSGKVCQKWSDNLPHQINSFITDRMFPDGSKEAAQNYCRNPNVKSGVWCYTMDVDVEWEYCNTCPDNFEGYSGVMFSIYTDQALEVCADFIVSAAAAAARR